MKRQSVIRDASVGCIQEDHWCVYADGFLRAAEILVENIRTTYELNTVVFPVLFLYRQYIELSLKEAIAYGRYLNESQQGTPKTHDLKSLWYEAKGCISKHITDVDKGKLQEVEKVVLELHQLDPTSEASRYPVVKKTQAGSRVASFSQGPTHINIDDLADKMKTVSDLLHYVTGALSVAQDLEAEYRAEFYIWDW
jgi:hypothetical protein